MRIAILSDLHANLHALEAVWSDVAGQKPDLAYCLGDLVGYGAYPNETVEWVRRQGIPTVMGNYDEGVGFDLEDCGCVYRLAGERALGDQSLHWTRDHTRAENKAFLRELPLQIRPETGRTRLLLVHGSPRKMNEYLYADRPQATFERLAKMAGADVVLFGHTHLPYQRRAAGTLFVNAGSVGKPKDGDPRAGYVLLDLGWKTIVTFRRVTYDVSAAATAVRQGGLPAAFADQLEHGGDSHGQVVALPAQEEGKPK